MQVFQVHLRMSAWLGARQNSFGHKGDRRGAVCCSQRVRKPSCTHLWGVKTTFGVQTYDWNLYSGKEKWIQSKCIFIMNLIQGLFVPIDCFLTVSRTAMPTVNHWKQSSPDNGIASRSELQRATVTNELQADQMRWEDTRRDGRTCRIWNRYPPEIYMSPKRVPFQKEMSFSNHQFFWGGYDQDMLVFRGVMGNNRTLRL